MIGYLTLIIALAANIDVTEDIATSTTWTADNTYNLTKQIYVLPGATLTIEAGTIIASEASANGAGGLCVTNGAQIFVNGERHAPVVMTSSLDDGTWRASANEWGNLTLCGDAFIGFDGTTNSGGFPNNTLTPSASNQANMEGLVETAGDPSLNNYGGGDDDYDAGNLSYLSIRYAGRVVGLSNELNGLSLGAIGRNTKIHHIEVMNNVDDGIEIWGGTVDLKYVSIWNVGDDSFDVDQGWRGRAQFGLIVQGYSRNASQGSGLGDNIFEFDGAENSDAQPRTRAAIYNFTTIANTESGDGTTTWRDNASVQFRNNIFIGKGDKLVRADGDDGDGSSGYGHNGTLTLAERFETDAVGSDGIAYIDPVNAGASSMMDNLYQAQTDGKLAELSNNIISGFGDISDDPYYDIVPASMRATNVEIAELPIRLLQRGPSVNVGGKSVNPVVLIDPTPIDSAIITTPAPAPANGFYSPVSYRGGFAPDENWLAGWSAADEFGFLFGTSSGDCGSCQGDADGNGKVEFWDLVEVLANWGCEG